MTLNNCPFCGKLSVKIASHYVGAFGGYFRPDMRPRKYYVRCKICRARGPLAHSEDLAVQFWNYTEFKNSITKSWHYDSLRYKR